MFRNLGRSIKLLREIAGLSLEDLAKGTGIEEDCLAGFEQGKDLPGLESLERVLSVIGADFSLFSETLAFVDRYAVRLGRVRHLDSPRVEDECSRT